MIYKYSNKDVSIKGLILDMDGVLWRDSQSIGNLQNIFQIIREKKIKFVLATNNSTRTPEQYIEKLDLFKVIISPGEVLTSSIVAFDLLRKKFPEGGNLYIIGEDGLYHELERSNFSFAENNVNAVVVGMDRSVNYDKLKIATLLIRNGATFIGTNSDRTFPTPQGLVPGAGAILKAIETATDTIPLVVGKPAPEMYHLAIKRMGIKPEETLVVGDRIETDIIGGINLGCVTALVLSGVTTFQQANNEKVPIDYIADDLSSLIAQIQ